MKPCTLIDCFSDIISSHGDKTAVTFLRQGLIETEITYRELLRDTGCMADTFLEMGIKRGDRIIFYINKSLVHVVAHIAIQRIGAVSVPLNPGFKQSEMEYLVRDADAKLVVVGKEQERIIKEIDPGMAVLVVDTHKPYQDLDFFSSKTDKMPDAVIKPDDPGIIIYTSGTTGSPKGAVLTHENLVHDAVNIIDIWAIADSDVLCHALPLFHVHGLCFALHTALIAGAHVIMLDSFDAKMVIDTLSRREGGHICSVFMAVPSMYSRMMDFLGERGMDFSHMRLWTSGSAPLLVKDFKRIKKVLGKEPVEREGMTETGMNFSNPVKGTRKSGSIGLPLPGLLVTIVDQNTFEEVEQGETGELWIRSLSITPGYWRKPEETEKAFKDGWFRTGDLGRVDEDGYFYISDRIKHIIISGGENISPKEVETVINRIDGVAESSVVGIPDEKWGEKVAAAVKTKPGSGIEPIKVQEYCKEHLHNWKCPKEILIVDELPKNRMGKILKDEVRKLF